MKHRFLKGIPLLFFVYAAVFLPQAASGLEKLNNQDLRGITAQAGISLASNEAVFEYWEDSLKIQDVGTLDRDGMALSPDGYVTLDLRALLVADDTFKVDIGGFNKEQQLQFTDHMANGETTTRYFDHPLNNIAMVFLSHAANDPYSILSANNISVFNHQSGTESMLGDLDLTEIQIHKSRLNIYPPAEGGSCGLRGIAGTQLEVHSMAYTNPDGLENIALTGFMAGSSFSGDTLPEGPSSTNQIDTGTWAFESGMFELGIPYYYHDNPDEEDTELDSYPFSFDITTDDTRSGNFQSYMAINAPVRGSLRIKNISSDSFDMGPIAIDGIRLYKNVVEFPGRGIGH